MNLEKILNVGKKLVVGGLIFSTIFFGCKKDEVIGPVPEPEPTEETILYDNVNILEEENLTKFISYGDAHMNFSENMGYNVGDILAGGESEILPLGFLYKVTSVKNNGKKYGVTQASFDEAIEKGKFTLEKKIIEEKKSTNGRFEIPISEILYDEDNDLSTTDDQIIMEGMIYLNPTITVDAEWNKGLQYFEFGFETEVGAEIFVGSNIEKFDIVKEKFILGPNIPAFPINVCGVPAVVKPFLRTYVGVEGEFSPSSVSISEIVNQESKIIYENKNWNSDITITNNFEFENFVPPESLELRAYAKPELTFLIYYTFGPSASVEGYLKAKANFSENPPWQISAGMDINLGAEMQIFGKNIWDYEEKVWGLEKVIAEGEEIPITGTFTDPRDGREYNIVKIGEDWWFKENLEYDFPGSVYHPEDVNKEYGRLYNCMDTTNLCPTGWHIPIFDNWYNLEENAGGYWTSGGELKEKGTDHWNSPNVDATDIVEFSAFGGGYFSGYENKYLGFREIGVFNNGIGGRVIQRGSDETYSIGYLLDKYSVRCVKD